MKNKKFEIGDIVRIKSWDAKQDYFMIKTRRHLKNKLPELIVYKISKIKTAGEWIVLKEDCIKILEYKTVKLFNNDKNLLRFLKIYD